MKKFLIFLFFSILMISCAKLVSNEISQKGSPSEIEWIHFEWVSFSKKGQKFEKAAFKIPVKIDELPRNFYMQFDLAAPTTCLYGNNFKPILKRNPSLDNKLDTTKTFWIQGKENPMFRNVNLKLDNVVFKGIDVGLFTNYGHRILNFIYRKSPIGTIGADIFQNKVLIIDYKSSRLAVIDTLPTEYQDAYFADFSINNGRISVPFRINGNVEYLMFDTGSGIFSLVTSKENALKIGGTEIVDSLKVPSWGELITFYGLKTIFPIKFEDKNLGSPIVYYDEVGTFDVFYQQQNIWGLTGNAFFLDDIVIIDYVNKRFGVK